MPDVVYIVEVDNGVPFEHDWYVDSVHATLRAAREREESLLSGMFVKRTRTERWEVLDA